MDAIAHDASQQHCACVLSITIHLLLIGGAVGPFQDAQIRAEFLIKTGTLHKTYAFLFKPTQNFQNGNFVWR